MAQINSNWTAPTFSFDAADQPTAWTDFYIRALHYLETLRIKPAEEDEELKGWTEIKMMFRGEDRRALQTLIDNDTIKAADQCTPTLALKAIQTAIKEGEHYWHYRDEVLSDIRQQPEEQVHTLSNRIIDLVNNCNFQDQTTRDHQNNTITTCDKIPRSTRLDQITGPYNTNLQNTSPALQTTRTML